MGNYTHSERLLSVTTPLGKDTLLVDGFSGTEGISEGISELTVVELDLLASPQTPVTPSSLVGQRVTLAITVDSNGDQRYFNGIVRSLALVSADTEFLVYKAEVVPSLWLLTLNAQTRVFQGKTVIDIAKAVLTSYSITPKDLTQTTYQALDYCTQYRESDYAFLERLLAQHGIAFFFTHTASDHTMVLADSPSQFVDCAIQTSYRYMPETDERAGFYDMYVQRFEARSALVTGKQTLWEYRYTQFARQPSNPASSESKAATGDNGHEWYDYADGPSSWTKTTSSDANIATMQALFQNVARDREDAQSLVVQGSSNASLFAPGFNFTLTTHPDSAQNIRYLLLRVRHTARQEPPFRQSAPAGVAYQNSFTAQPATLTFRPPPQPKPRVNGVVTGKVVAPSGDDSYLDQYGRVCVQFWWDRTRQPNTTDNTLLRVAQPWAGAGWGTYFWPRMGDEVLIDFLDGDPDAPVVVGSLYNGTNLPKYNPATAYTRSGVLTRSSKNGSTGKANELRFEDLSGSEQVYLHAERDYDTQVEHDRHVQIGNEQHITVKANQYETLQGEAHRKITKDRIDEIDGDAHLTVGGAETRHVKGAKGETVDKDSAVAITGTSHISVSQACNEKIGANYSLQVGATHLNKAASFVVNASEQVFLQGGASVVIESGLEGLCLSGPGGFIAIGPEGITIQGLMVMINSGGASLEGTPAVPQDPQSPASPNSPTDATWNENNAG